MSSQIFETTLTTMIIFVLIANTIIFIFNTFYKKNWTYTPLVFAFLFGLFIFKSISTDYYTLLSYLPGFSSNDSIYLTVVILVLSLADNKLNFFVRK